jgi:hypothetical protein
MNLEIMLDEFDQDDEEIDTHSMPEIIFSYSSHHGTWSSFFAFSMS